MSERRWFALWEADLSGLVPHLLGFTLVWTYLSSMVAGIIGVTLGGLAAHFGRTAGGVVASLSGAAFAAVAVAVPLGFTVATARPWRRTLLFWAGTAAAAFALDQYIPQQHEWRLFRWAVVAAASGAVLAAFFQPIHIASGGKPESAREGEIVVRIGLVFGYFVREFDGGRIGCTVAGALAGAMGAAASAAIGIAAAPEEFLDCFGTNRAFLPIAFAVIGAIGGGSGGWFAWSVATTRQPSADEISDAP